MNIKSLLIQTRLYSSVRKKISYKFLNTILFLENKRLKRRKLKIESIIVLFVRVKNLTGFYSRRMNYCLLLHLIFSNFSHFTCGEREREREREIKQSSLTFDIDYGQ